MRNSFCVQTLTFAAMVIPIFMHREQPLSHSITVLGRTCIFSAFLLAGASFAHAQSAQQPTTPTRDNGTGITAPTNLNTYNTVRTPSITLTLGTPVRGSVASKVAALTALASGADTPATPGVIQPQSRNGVFNEVNLGFLDSGGAAPAPATVTLQFDVSRAGASVWIQPLDGGAVLAQDANGNPVSSPSGYMVMLNASGQLVFGFQAPTLTGRYQVLIRLDNVSTILPFIIPDPSQDN